MMKKILTLIICLMMIIPTITNAQTQALNLKDTIIDIGQTPSFDENDYKETEDQVIVYLFRSPTCQHCHAAIEYFNSLVETYGEKFKLRSYDVVNNKDNKALKDKITNFLNINAPNVPLMIIGEQSIYGFGDSSKEVITTAIDKEYEKTEKYDVIDEMAKERKETKKPSYVIALLLGVALVIVIILFIRKSLKK